MFLINVLKDGLSTNLPLLGVVIRRTPLDGNKFCPHVTKGNNSNMMINFMVYFILESAEVASSVTFFIRHVYPLMLGQTFIKFPQMDEYTLQVLLKSTIQP